MKSERLFILLYALEEFNRQLRKYTKIRTVFPTDDSLRKSINI